MDIWVKSRTKMEDYTWRSLADCAISIPPPSIEFGYEQWKFEDCVPWFGVVFTKGKATLFFGNLTTQRNDSRGRPIFVHAALQSENDTEIRDIRGIVSSLLVQEKDLIPEWTAFFLNIFDGKPSGAFPVFPHATVACPVMSSIGHFEYPREDFASRQYIAEWLCSDRDSQSFLAVGTTGRSGKGIFERVCKSQGKWQAAFFSSTCSSKSELVAVPDPLEKEGPKKNFFDGRIGGLLLAAIMAVVCIWAVRELCKPGGSQSNPPPGFSSLGEDRTDHSGDGGASSGGDSPGMKSGVEEGGENAPAGSNPLVPADVLDFGILETPAMPETGDRTVSKPEPREEEGGAGGDDRAVPAG